MKTAQFDLVLRKGFLTLFRDVMNSAPESKTYMCRILKNVRKISKRRARPPRMTPEQLLHSVRDLSLNCFPHRCKSGAVLAPVRGIVWAILMLTKPSTAFGLLKCYRTCLRRMNYVIRWTTTLVFKESWKQSAWRISSAI